MALHPFRANRFNVLFELAAGVFYHRKHIQMAFDEGWIPPTNRLLQSVNADIHSVPLLAGARALGIIYKQLTETYWRLLDHPEVHIVDLAAHIRLVYSKLQLWKNDPSSLMDIDMPPLFILPSGEEIKPVKDMIFDELYAITDAVTEQLTRKALSVICSAISVVFDRRFKEQLTEQYSDKVRKETADMPTSNQRGENDFGVWAYLKQLKPSMNAMSLEGNALFLLNHTGKRLAMLRISDPEKYNSIMKTARERRREMKKIYVEWDEKNKHYAEQRMKHQQEEFNKQKARKADRENMWDSTVKSHGGELRSAMDVRRLRKKVKKLNKAQRLKGYHHHIFFMKNKYPEQMKNLPKPVVTVTGKSEDQLLDNLKQIVACIHGESHSEIESDSSSNDEDADNETSGSEDWSTDESEDNEPLPKRAAYDTENWSYEFKVMDIVAVAYENAWYLGCVKEVLSTDLGKIAFTEQLKKNQFVWLDDDDKLEEIDAKYVFACDIELLPHSSLRYFHLTKAEHAKVEEKYKQYAQKWFK